MEGRHHVVKVNDFMYPTRPKQGYRTVPDYDKVLLKMTRAQLEVVQDFTVENAHGRIQFLGCCDLTDVDLARDVIIKPRAIEVYPNDSQKPEVGEKLNRGALVTLAGGIRPKPGLSW